MVVHTVHKGAEEYTTHMKNVRAPIIDGLGRAPPRPRAAGHLITVFFFVVFFVFFKFNRSAK